MPEHEQSPDDELCEAIDLDTVIFLKLETIVLRSQISRRFQNELMGVLDDVSQLATRLHNTRRSLKNQAERLEAIGR